MVDYSRRRLLGYGSVAMVAAGFGTEFLTTHAQADTPAAGQDDAPAPVIATASDAFVALSKTLTGYPTPDADLGNRLYHDLLAMYPNLDAAIPQIAAEIAKTPSGPTTFTDPALGTIYKQIVGGWYLGVIGPKLAPRCIAFEDIVSYKVLAKSIMPPSYCVGEPMFWIHKPAV